MFVSDYKPEVGTNVNSKFFDCPDGEYRAAILTARVCQSRSGKQMVEVSVKVENSNGIPARFFIVEGDNFNRNATSLFDAFKIDRGNFNFQSWTGKVALAHVEHVLNDKGYSNATVKYFKAMLPASTPTAGTKAPNVAPVTQQRDSQDGFPDEIPF